MARLRTLKQDDAKLGWKKAGTAFKVTGLTLGSIVSACVTTYTPATVAPNGTVIPATELPAIFSTLIPLIDKHSTLLFVLSAAISLTASIALFYLNRVSGWAIIKVLLNQFSEVVFKERNHNARAFHRVTLFKYQCWGLTHWHRDRLIPKVRSGHLFQKTRTVFVANDNPELCNGVVGKAWAESDPIIISQLQPIKDLSPSSSKYRETIEAYATSTYTKVEWVTAHRENLFARSFYAVKVEVNSKPWGVLILDSVNPEGIRVNDLITEFPIALSVITKVIKDFNL